MGQSWYHLNYPMYRMPARGPIAQLGLELPAHNRLVPGSNPGGPISISLSTRQQNVSTKWTRLERVTLKSAHAGEKLNCAKK